MSRLKKPRFAIGEQVRVINPEITHWMRKLRYHVRRYVLNETKDGWDYLLERRVGATVREQWRIYKPEDLERWKPIRRKHYRKRKPLSA